MKYFKYLIFTLLITFQGCRIACPDETYEVINLTDEDKSFNQYDGFQLIVFENTLGEKKVFNGQGRNYTYEAEYENAETRCGPTAQYDLERENLYFKSNNQDMTIDLDLEVSRESSTNFVIRFNNEEFDILTWLPPKYDTITINGKKYQDVFFRIHYDTELFYSKKDGIIRFKLNDQEVWTIKQ